MTHMWANCPTHHHSYSELLHTLVWFQPISIRHLKLPDEEGESCALKRSTKEWQRVRRRKREAGETAQVLAWTIRFSITLAEPASPRLHITTPPTNPLTHTHMHACNLLPCMVFHHCQLPPSLPSSIFHLLSLGVLCCISVLTSNHQDFINPASKRRERHDLL